MVQRKRRQSRIENIVGKGVKINVLVFFFCVQMMIIMNTFSTFIKTLTLKLVYN